MTVTHTILNSEFGEIYTWLNTQEYIKNLITTDIGKDLEFDNTFGIAFENAAGTTNDRIFQNADDELEVHLNTAGGVFLITDHADADFFSVDDSNTTINAWRGSLMQVWDSGNTDYIQTKHDGTNATILTGGTGGGDLILDPAGNNVLPGSDSTDSLGSASVRWANAYLDAVDISGTATVGSLSSSGAVSGTSGTFTSLLHINGNFLRITNNSDVLDIDCDGTDVVYNGSAGVSVHKFNKAVSGNGAYINHSDKRLKKNIKTAKAGLAEILKLNAVTFERKGDANRGTEGGFLADEVEKVLPHAVYTHGDGIKGIAMDNLFPVFVNAFKELNAKVDAA